MQEDGIEQLIKMMRNYRYFLIYISASLTAIIYVIATGG